MPTHAALQGGAGANQLQSCPLLGQTLAKHQQKAKKSCVQGLHASEIDNQTLPTHTKRLPEVGRSVSNIGHGGSTRQDEQG